MKKLILYSVLVFMFSCKKEILVNIVDRPASLVVNAELTSDSFISMNLSLTQNISDNNTEKKVANAVIEVLDKDSLILDVLSYAGNGTYRSGTIKPKVGKNYIFRISHFDKLYWVNEPMPDSMKVNLLDTSRGVFQGQTNFFQFKLDVSNDVNKNNFHGFRIKRILKNISNLDTTTIEEWSDIQSMDFILTENPESRFSKKHLLFTDQYFIGLKQEFKFGTSILDKANQKTIKLVLYVSNYSQSAYNYYTSVNEHLFYQNDPFSQPTVLKGNVQNAYGAAVGQFTKLFEVQLQ